MGGRRPGCASCLGPSICAAQINKLFGTLVSPSAICCSVEKDLLSAFHMSGIMLGARDTERKTAPSLEEVMISKGRHT